MKKYKILNYIIQTQFGGNSLQVRQHRNNKNITNVKKCIKFITNNKVITKEIGKGSQGQIYIVENNKCGTIVIKHFNKSDTFNKELKALNIIKTLIINNTCPNFIMLYGSDKIKNNVYLEYIDNDIKHLYNNFLTPINSETCKSLIFQILYGLLCQYELCNIKHNDTQMINIFVKFINTKSVFCYTINAIKYYVPTYGNLFMLGDYGCSTFVKESKQKIPNPDFNSFLNNILFVFTRKLYEDDNINTIDKLYNIVPKDVMFRNNINYDELLDEKNKNKKNASISDVTRKTIRKIMVICIKLKLFDYKKYFINYNFIDIILEILEYDNIPDVFKNLCNFYSSDDIDEITEFTEVII
jgi:hypothetical protein